MSLSTEFLTTRELADLLHIKERKVYELAASGAIPCSRATGKLLFPRQEVEAWVARHSSGAGTERAGHRRNVFLGSYDPLLEWSLRAAGTELATFLDGSLDGLERFAAGEGVAAGLHVYDPDSDDWNVAAVRACCGHAPVALLEFAWRERGLIVAPGEEFALGEVAALCGRRVAPRQEAAGTQVLLRHLMAKASVDAADISWGDTVRTESDAALAVLEGKVDAALGLRAIADQLRLGFVPLVRERFDILVDRKAWFDPPLQRLHSFMATDGFRAKAAEMTGYDIGGLGRVHFNGA
ncbi:MAG: helix-turn-helix transcriptional regulator [Gammaproteobacteria bacterium]|nr:helix-turn-helix transcriptional regulator [Gammaproteobacteria bacterium]